MKALVVGSGGREHTLAWKLAQSPKIEKIYCAPGNAGTASIAENISTGVDYIGSLLSFAIDNEIGLTVVGPEMALADGIADVFERQGLKIFGPRQQAAQLEASKTFAKQFMKKHAIPTAAYEVFSNAAQAKAYIESVEYDVVVKADGLAAGKGVLIPKNKEEACAAIDDILERRAFGPAGATCVIEQRLEGDEATLLCFCDGVTIKPMVSSQDHKRALDGDQGLNTGGMGVYAPTPLVTDVLMAKVKEQILDRIIAGMQAEEMDFRGVLYVGLMIVKGEPYVLEFNVRFGDPECQVVIPLLESDLVDVCLAVAERKLADVDLRWSTQHACHVTMASGGYPQKFERGFPISGLDKVENALVFHAGTALDNGQVVTSGGRVLGVTALGDTLPDAIATAYREIEKIDFKNKHYRTDIGAKASRYL
ncbi:MAG TPA: phosphoribosylamine--glycine ligase [bacterium]|nr:phosphoribosylamine--glycine ligase [bacterium]